jgi:hypothetical protein
MEEEAREEEAMEIGMYHLMDWLVVFFRPAKNIMRQGSICFPFSDFFLNFPLCFFFSIFLPICYVKTDWVTADEDDDDGDDFNPLGTVEAPF